MPTDTVYGLAADPRVDGWLERICHAKGRPEAKPIAFLASGADQVEAFGAVMGPVERALVARFWPGPLTLVLKTGPARDAPPAGETVPREGFRVPDHDVALELLCAVGCVLRVTSANRSGAEPARNAQEAAASLGAEVSVVLDSGPSPGGVPSTVVEVVAGVPRILRAGAIALESIRACVAGGILRGSPGV
jgi:L-threonylcarbamoyladenylate synthase